MFFKNFVVLNTFDIINNLIQYQMFENKKI